MRYCEGCGRNNVIGIFGMPTGPGGQGLSLPHNRLSEM